MNMKHLLIASAISLGAFALPAQADVAVSFSFGGHPPRHDYVVVTERVYPVEHYYRYEPRREVYYVEREHHRGHGHGRHHREREYYRYSKCR